MNTKEKKQLLLIIRKVSTGGSAEDRKSSRCNQSQDGCRQEPTISAKPDNHRVGVIQVCRTECFQDLGVPPYRLPINCMEKKIAITQWGEEKIKRHLNQLIKIYITNGERWVLCGCPKKDTKSLMQWSSQESKTP